MSDVKERKITSQDVIVYMKEDVYDDGEDIDVLRREMNRIKNVLAAVIATMNPSQLLAVSKELNGNVEFYERGEWVKLTD